METFKKFKFEEITEDTSNSIENRVDGIERKLDELIGALSKPPRQANEQPKKHKQNESFKKYYEQYESNEYDEYGKSTTNVNEYDITEKSTSISTISNAYEQWPKSTNDFKSDDG